MILLSVTNLRKHFGPEPVLDGVTFDIHPGDRIGLVGPNGCGKTTLMKIIAGQAEVEGGAREMHESVKVGYLEQQPDFAPGRTLWQEAESAMESLIEIRRHAEQTASLLAEEKDPEEHRRLAERYDHLQHELERRDGYNLEYKVKRVLDGLRFPESTFSQPVASLSGGEQNRLILAKLLLAEPDLMLLDEPSNHLDIEATEWLEDFLVSTSAAVLVVSHDRSFLDKTTNKTLELFRGTVDTYVGNYSAYVRQKAERLLVEQRTYEKQQIEIAKMEDFVRRHSYGQKHQQAEDRRKKLERIERVPEPREILPPAMRFPATERSGDIVLRVSDVAKGFDSRPLFENVTFEIARGERWAILGPNGSGKTTLLRILLGELEPDAGNVSLGHGVDVGYFDQHLDMFDDEAEVADGVRPNDAPMEIGPRRNLLARFGITGDAAFQKIGKLSGGERCRMALARLSASEANFLILDEPTNHLDLWAIGALEKAINEFDGTVLFISHDRFFIDQTADHLLVVEPEDGRCRVIHGNYDTYRHFLNRDASEAEDPSANKVKLTPSASKKPADVKPKKKRRFPFRKVADIEADIFEHETKIEELHEEMASPEALRDGIRIRELNTEVEETKEALKTLYEHWEEATDLNW